MNSSVKKLSKKLCRNYLLFWIISILLSSIIIGKTSYFSLNKEFNIPLESISVILTLAAIWGTFQYFKLRLKKITNQQDSSTILMNYEKLFNVCLIILFLVIIIDVLVFKVTRSYSSLLCAGMILVATTLSVPSENKIKKGLQIDQDVIT